MGHVPSSGGFTAPTVESLAHHGWSWTTGGNIELAGILTAVRLGNLHGILRIDVEGEEWRAKVGQPWRNERAGLKDGDLAEVVEIRLIGEPAASAHWTATRHSGWIDPAPQAVSRLVPERQRLSESDHVPIRASPHRAA